MIRSPVLRWGTGLVLACAWLAAVAVPALGGVANAGLPGAPATNPIAGLPWGIYRGPIDGLYPAYQRSRGENRRLLAKEALEPTVQWMGGWFGNQYARTVVRQIIAASGGPNHLTEIAVFRGEPWEAGACFSLPSAADQLSYMTWITNFAAGIGSARVLIVLQPDLPFVLCAPHHSMIPLDLVAWAARTLSALPHTSVYIDAGAADYLSVRQAAFILEHGGIQYARGFSLNTTHSDGTGRQILYGRRVSAALAAAGFPGKHFVVNTAQNGSPFRRWKYSHLAEKPPICGYRGQRACIRLGIPPGSDVTDPRWHLTRRERGIASRLLDGYVWTSRPWLPAGQGGFDLQLALQLARTSPF